MFVLVRQYCAETVLPELREGEPVRVGNDGSARWSPLPGGGGKAVLRRLLPGALNLNVSLKVLIQR